MKSSLLLVALFIIALFTGAALFFYKSKIPDIYQLNNAVQLQLNRVSSLDTNTNELALKNRINIETNYDTITKSVSQLKRSVKNMAEKNAPFLDPKNALLNKRYKALQQEIEVKSDFIENFKTRFAVLRNSERYVPVVGERLVLTAQQNNLTDIATLYRDTIITAFNFSSPYDKNADDRLPELIIQLQATEAPMPDEALSDIIEFTRHTQTMLNEKLYVDTYLNNALQTRTQENITELNLAWHEWLKQFDHPKRLLEYAIIAYIAYILIILAVALFLLRLRYKNLAQNVEEKTSELKLTFDQLQQSEIQLMQAEKMSSLGQLVAGIAHEVNTPLGYVSSNISTIKRDLHRLDAIWVAIQKLNQEIRAGGKDRHKLSQILREIVVSYRDSGGKQTVAELSELLDDSVQGLSEISQLVISLNDFSRIDKSDNSAANVHESLKSTIKICSNVIGERKITRLYNSDLPEIPFSAIQLNQVFLNILTNAAYATSPDDGEIRITTDLRDDQVLIEFLDNGCGMDTLTERKIFDPFFTTKGVNEGTGLGMSIVYKLVKGHGGDIEVNSRLGEGTTIRILLPVTTGEQ